MHRMGNWPVVSFSVCLSYSRGDKDKVREHEGTSVIVPIAKLTCIEGDS